MRDRDFEDWMRKHWNQNSKPYHNETFYLAACAQGEAGELFKIFKKAHKVQGKPSPDLTPEELKEAILEAGDTIHYCVRLMQKFNVDIEQILGMNYSKIIMRYQEQED